MPSALCAAISAACPTHVRCLSDSNEIKARFYTCPKLVGVQYMSDTDMTPKLKCPCYIGATTVGNSQVLGRLMHFHAKKNLTLCFCLLLYKLSHTRIYTNFFVLVNLNKVHVTYSRLLLIRVRMMHHLLRM